MGRLKDMHRPYLLPGGLWTLWASSLLLWLLPCFVLFTFLHLRSVRDAPQAAAALEQRIAQLEGVNEEV